MSLDSCKSGPRPLPFNRSFGSLDDEFGIPASPPSRSSVGLKLSVTGDSGSGLTKGVTRDPGLSTDDSLGVPHGGGMSRRASCPNFNIPEFTIAPPDSSRLAKKRQSISQISHSILQKFNTGEGNSLKKVPPSPITEQPEIVVSKPDDDLSTNMSVEKENSISDNKSLAMSPSLKRPGFLSATVSSFFSAKQHTANELNPSDSLTNQSVTDGVPQQVPKKSYLMRRAAAISNADVNAMAPSSM